MSGLAGLSVGTVLAFSAVLLPQLQQEAEEEKDGGILGKQVEGETETGRASWIGESEIQLVLC